MAGVESFRATQAREDHPSEKTVLAATKAIPTPEWTFLVQLFWFLSESPFSANVIAI
jgi:hypothetical protein